MEDSFLPRLVQIVYSNQHCSLPFYFPGFKLSAKALHSTNGPNMPLTFSKALH